jgi:threonine/homoserine/homoserine lactone efflux protein
VNAAVPFALGVAASPVPVASMILLLSSQRGRLAGGSFAVGWIVGVAAAALSLVLLVAATGVSDSDPAWIGVAEIVLGVGFAVAAIRIWVRSSAEQTSATPRWLQALDDLSPARSAVVGVVLAGANPKVIALCLGAALALAEADAGAPTSAAGVLAFATVGAAGVVAPLLLYLAAPARAGVVLARLREWLVRNDRTVLVVLGFVLAAIFVAGGYAVLRS